MLAVHAETTNSTPNGLSSWSRPITGVFATAVPADMSNLAITEMHFHPSNPTAVELAALPLATDDDFEFIELANTGSNAISLIGVQFTLGITFDFTNSSITTLQPGETILLVEDLAAFQVRYGASGLPVGGQYAGKISNGGEQITLVDASGQIIHNYVYDDVVPWPTAADGSGPSMEIRDTAGNYNSAFNWRATSPVGGTPGTIPGDFNGDAQLTCADVDILTSIAVAGANAPSFDLNGDSAVDATDVAYWVALLRGTRIADANLDGTIDNADFDVWNSNRFTANAGYCGGDFNTDGVTDVSDFNLWNQSRDAVVAATISGATIPNMDVNADGIFSPLDALHVINFLNSNGMDGAYDPQLDFNLDGFVSPIDALIQVNRLNGTTNQSAEPILVDAYFAEDDEGDDDENLLELIF